MALMSSFVSCIWSAGVSHGHVRAPAGGGRWREERTSRIGFGIAVFLQSGLGAAIWAVYRALQTT